MAAISIAIARGKDGFKISDFTVGTSAPGAGDMEFRFNTTDTNSAAIKINDIIRGLLAIRRALETTDSNVNVITIPTE